MDDDTVLVYKNSIGSAPNSNNSTRIIIPYFTYHNSRMVISPKLSGFQKNHKVSDKSKKNLQKDKLKGTLLKSTIKKITNQLTTWLSSINTYNSLPNVKKIHKKYYPVFITLTLSSIQKHSDNFIKRYMLGAFIKSIKLNYGVKYYYWRAEKQKNGNIHFHLIVDKYIDYNSLRQKWNLIQENS